MRTLSATEAFTPALERTKAILQPFSLRLWLKLGLVALCAELGGQFAFPPIGNPAGLSHSSSSGIGAVSGGVTLIVAVVFAIFALVGFAIALAFLYLSSRMQFVLMDLVATRSTYVAPAWRRHGSKTWRWIGLKVLFFLGILLIAGVLFAYPIILFIHSMPFGNAQPGAAFFGSFFLFFAVIFCFVLLLMLFIWLLRDFVLPFIVFEDASIGAALSHAIELIRREPGPVLFYLLMKFLLSMGVGIAAELCLFLAALVGAIPLGLITGILWLALHHGGPIVTILMYVSFGLLGLIFLAWMLIAGTCIVGATLIFYQAYALYFLGGRIPSLGNILEPPAPPMPYAVSDPETQPPLAPA